MLSSITHTRRPVPLASGTIAVLFAVERWIAYLLLPPRSPARWCGNCTLGFVGIPLELGVIGLIVVWRCLRREDILRDDAIWWFGAGAGVLLTPFVIGFPLFVGCLAFLLWPERREPKSKRPAAQ